MSSQVRLSKLSQYLSKGNYEQAVEIYNRKMQSPQTEGQYLLLAKAFYIGEHYSQVLTLFNSINNLENIQIEFQVKLLKLKAQYLHSLFLPLNKVLKVESWMKQNQKHFNNYHSWCLDQIKLIAQNNLAKKLSDFPRQILNDEKNEFLSLFRKYDNYNPIMQGMPVYLVSQRWFNQWQKYISLDSSVSVQNPGPITNFEIVDHIYQGFFDQRKQKSYTNYYLFQPCQYRIVPKQCWKFLSDKYGGIPVVRYNISNNSKPNQIITEVYLKKIGLAHKSQVDFLQNQSYLKDVVTFVQITKKQNWKGLIQNKLEKTWGANGTIFQLSGRNIKKVDLSQCLQDCDTVDKIFIYTNNQRNENTFDKQTKQKCANKTCTQSANLKLCQCKTVKYCDMTCLKQDRDRHRRKCDLQLQHLKQKSAIIQNFNIDAKSYGGRKGLVGLRNLGNTCYMNSGLQCLSNTKQITDYFMSNEFIKHINSSNPLGTKGNLACAYAELIKEMWGEGQEVVSPFNLKKMIGKFAAQFSGFGQQDSQQFISYLIDGLQEDLNLVKKKQTFEVRDEVIPDEEASLESEINYSKRIKSHVRDLMAGQFKSTVQCSQCNKLSVCFDPYLLLSLPIPKPKICEFLFVSADVSQDLIGFSFEINEATTFRSLDKKLKIQYHYVKNIVYAELDLRYKLIGFIQNLDQRMSARIRPTQLLLGYQISLENYQNQIYLVEHLYTQRSLDIPRLVSFPKIGWQKHYQKFIQCSFGRAKIKQSDDVIQSVQKFDSPQLYNKVCNRYLAVHCKKNLKLMPKKSEINYFSFQDEKIKLTLANCLQYFSHKQTLEKQNQWYCNKCKRFVNAEKQLEIFKSNKILVIAFKRFNKLQKIKQFIDVPIEGFDIGRFIKSNKALKPILYDLYGVVNHYGSLGGGHYTAFCQNFLNKKWYEFNDSSVEEISKREIISDNSYVLFFRRKD